MRPLVLIGVVLIFLGGFLLYRGGFTTRKTVLDLGDVKVTEPNSHPVPPWAAGATVAVGLGLVAAGVRRRRA